MNWTLILPELYFVAAAGAFFVLSMAGRPDSKRDHTIALIVASLGAMVTLASVHSSGSLFFDVYRIDLFSQVFKVLGALGFFLVIALCSELDIAEDRHPEFYLLLSTATLGLMLLVSSVELLTLYVALELVSYSLYVLVPLRRGDGRHLEAGIKYFLIGAATSAVMLFGLGSLYGVTRTTYIVELARVLPEMLGTPMAAVGLLLTLGGFFFKLALFPFHVWAPGVYQGAANQVTAYIATGTKAAAMGVIARLVATATGGEHHLVDVLIWLAIGSMTLGNLVALVQEDAKRLLAYSAVAHAGYVLIGILCMNPPGYASAVFYAVAYLVMTFTCFMVVIKVAADGRDLQIPQLAGLHRRSPVLAVALFVGAFSLGGIPPTIGFTGKFLVFTAAMQNGYFLLVLIAMINVAISLYYYIRLIKAAYFLESDDTAEIFISVPTKLLAGVLVGVMVVGGIFPRYLYELAMRATAVLP